MTISAIGSPPHHERHSCAWFLYLAIITMLTIITVVIITITMITIT